MRAPIITLPRRGDVLGFLIAALLVGILAIASAYPYLSRQNAMSARLGPGWDCQQMPKGGPVCIKRLPKSPAD